MFNARGIDSDPAIDGVGIDGRYNIVARARIDNVNASASVDSVCSIASIDRVVAIATGKIIVEAAAGQRIVTNAPDKTCGVDTRCQRVVARAAVQNIGVIQENVVHLIGCGERVVAGSRSKRDGLDVDNLCAVCQQHLGRSSAEIGNNI